MEPEHSFEDLDFKQSKSSVGSDSGSTLEADSTLEESAFEITLSEPIRRSNQGALNAPYWAYKVTVKTSLPQYKDREITNERRYSDFEWLRNKLMQEYPGIIIPPIPEKSISGTVEKWFSSETTPLLEYRRRALQLFLQRVGNHPKLQYSNSLKEFFERKYDDLASLRKSDKAQTPRNRSSSSSSWFSGFFGRSRSSSSTTPTSSGSASSSAPSSSPTTTATGDARGSNGVLDWIQPITIYIERFEKVMRQLKDKFSSIVENHKELAQSSKGLSDAFKQVASLEEDSDDNSLGNALSNLIQTSDAIADKGNEQASQEQTLVVDMLTYYLGMCESVKSLIEWFKSKSREVTALEKSLNQLQSEQERAGMERSNKIAEEIRKKQEDHDSLMEEISNAERAFQADWKRFLQHKQRDIKQLVQAFVDVQAQFFDTAQQQWRQVIPNLNKAL